MSHHPDIPATGPGLAADEMHSSAELASAQRSGITRRRCLTTLAASAAAWMPLGLRAHGNFGPVQPPEPLPALPVQGTDGRASPLADRLKGQITAVQLMFTGCSATCPIQGAVFAEVQRQLASDGAGIRLLSVSIDPLGDDLKALKAWLEKFGAEGTRWNAALPKPNDLDRLLDFLRGRAPGNDRHTGQAFVFDRQARLVFRTEDLPEPAELAHLLRHWRDRKPA